MNAPISMMQSKRHYTFISGQLESHNRLWSALPRYLQRLLQSHNPLCPSCDVSASSCWSLIWANTCWVLSTCWLNSDHDHSTTLRVWKEDWWHFSLFQPALQESQGLWLEGTDREQGVVRGMVKYEVTSLCFFIFSPLSSWTWQKKGVQKLDLPNNAELTDSWKKTKISYTKHVQFRGWS